MFYTRINTYIHIDYYRQVDTCIICLLMFSISIYQLCHTMCFLHLFTSFTTKLMFIPKSFWSSEQSWWQRARTTWQHPKRPSPSAHQTGFQSWHCGWSEGSRQMKNYRKQKQRTLTKTTELLDFWEKREPITISIGRVLRWDSVFQLMIGHTLHELGATHLFVSAFIGCER